MKNTPRLMPLGLAVITSALAMVPINGWAIANWARKYNVDMRTGAYIVGIDRVAAATRSRGIWP